MRRTASIAIVMVAALVVAAASGLAWAATTVKFASPVKYGVGKSAVDVISTDFDEDGFQDLAVSKFGSSSVSVLLGIGNGTFEAAKPYAAGDNPKGITAADFNGDSHLDLAVGNSETNKVTILPGRGDGTFGAARAFDGGGSPAFGLVSTDFNNDGEADLAETNQVQDTVSVLLGRGDGTLGAPTDFAVGGQPIRLVDAQLNADGKPDLAVANLDDGSVSVLLGKGDGTFSAARTVVVTDALENSTLNDITDADFDGDGDTDLAVVSFSPGSIWVLLNKGDGTFEAPTEYGDVSDAHSITSADFNGDGRVDLAGTTATALESPTGRQHVWLLLGKGDGTFGEQMSFLSEFGYLVDADLSGDGKPDLAVAENPYLAGQGCDLAPMHNDR